MQVTANILVVDDDESMRAGCAQALSEEGYRVQAVENGRRGLEMVRRESFDIVLLDLKMPGIPGMDVLRDLREYDPNMLVVIITGFATIDAAVEAMKLGAYDFITKPFPPETLVSVVQRAVENRFLALEKEVVPRAVDDRMVTDTIIGRSGGMRDVIRLVKKVAPTDSTVLVTGETGVGKELVAHTIHRLSARSDKPFVTVDCGVLVESLFESEMFGHVKGAFTGAVETTRGKFEMADGGTIFLDEIANISIAMQARLLRVIQEQEISKVGSTGKIRIDVRIISATNRELLREIQAGRFREDLFYRFNVFPIRVPPLRERGEDIRLLAQYFLKKFTAENNRPSMRISDTALRFLEMHNWPGNVRELKNAVERAVVACDNMEIEIEDFSLAGRKGAPETGVSAGEGALAELEKREIVKALRRFEGHRSKTAEYLGINRKTLREKILKYDIDDDQ